MLLALALALACARPAPLPDEPALGRVTPEVDGLWAELVFEGDLDARVLSGDDADLVLLYGTEEGGSLDPCGCTDRPRGGLPRLAAYRDAVQAASPDVPVVLLNAGGWLSGEANLDGTTRADVPHRNRWMARGLDQLAPQALNIAAPELRGLSELPDDSPALPLVSAHLAPDQALGLDVQPYRLVEAGSLTVAVTGIAATGPRWMAPESWQVEDAEARARSVLAEVADQAEVVVLLAHALPEVAQELAEDGLVDVVVDGWTHRSFSAPFRVGDAVWVRAHHQTMRVGELRLTVGPEGITRGHERKVDLDESIQGDPTLEEIAARARSELRTVERTTFGKTLR